MEQVNQIKERFQLTGWLDFLYKGSMRTRLLRAFIPLALVIIFANVSFLILFFGYFGMQIPLSLMVSAGTLLVAGVVNLIIVLDITRSVGGMLDKTLKEKNQAHEMLVTQKFFYENMLNKIPVDVVVYDENFNYIYCNPSTIPDKKEREWIIGKSDFDYCKLKNMDEKIGMERKSLFKKAMSGKLALSVEQNYKDEKGNAKYTLRTIIPAEENLSLGKLYSGVSDTYISFGFDITSLKLQEEALKQKNKDLEKANFELDRFVYSASHDLKAPLSSVLGLINLSKNETEDPSLLNYLDMMERSIRKLDKFIKDLINFSRNNRMEIKSEPLDFNHIIRERVDELKYMDDATKVRLEKNIQPDAFWSDESRISTILNNLISNSVKYHNPKNSDPWIKIDTVINPNHATIIVKDNGIGIDHEHIDKIFNMFYRATEHSQGSGLGLYIVKEIVHKMNGTISVASNPGMGTEFKIILPNMRPTKERYSDVA